MRGKSWSIFFSRYLPRKYTPLDAVGPWLPVHAEMDRLSSAWGSDASVLRPSSHVVFLREVAKSSCLSGADNKLTHVHLSLRQTELQILKESMPPGCNSETPMLSCAWVHWKLMKVTIPGLHPQWLSFSCKSSEMPGNCAFDKHCRWPQYMVVKHAMCYKSGRPRFKPNPLLWEINQHLTFHRWWSKPIPEKLVCCYLQTKYVLKPPIKSY